MEELKTAIPTRRQLEFQEWEFGLFLHFGIRTFYEGHADWDGKPMSAAAFSPSALDCDQWAETAKRAGANYIVLTAKHHDGFALWNSRYTDFSVASSPWKAGKGDVLREFTDACRRHDLKIGLYYSPMDASGAKYADAKVYDDYFIAQISEILTGYGAIDMLWFDGCGSENHAYDWSRIMGEVRRMQPEILIFNMGDPDYRWIGNEAGLAPSPCWNTVSSVEFSIQTEAKESGWRGKPVWLPAECDCRMRDFNWFYSDADAHTIKSVEELLGIYYYSVGRGCNLLLNIGPDRRGLLPDADASRLLEFAAERDRRFAAPYTAAAKSPSRYVFTPAAPLLLNHVAAQEDLTDGERIREFTVKIQPEHGREAITVYTGRSIGHRAVCRFPEVRAHRAWLEITRSDGESKMRSVAFYAA